MKSQFSNFSAFRTCNMKQTSLADKLDGTLKVFEIFGLQLFSLRSVFTKAAGQQWTSFRIIYFIVLCTICFVFGCLILLTSFSTEKVTTKNVLSVFYLQLLNYFFLTALGSSLIQSAISMKNIQRVFISSQEISNICEKDFSVVMKFGELRKSTLKKICVMVITAIAASCATVYAQFDNAEEFELLNTSIVTTFLSMIVCKFSFFVDLVNLQIRHVEELFVLIFKAKPTQTYEKVYRIDVMEKRGKEELRKLTTVWKIYIKVSENASIINRSMGLTILLVVVIAIMVVTYAVYDVCLAIMDDSGVQLGKIRIF